MECLGSTSAQTLTLLHTHTHTQTHTHTHLDTPALVTCLISVLQRCLPPSFTLLHLLFCSQVPAVGQALLAELRLQCSLLVLQDENNALQGPLKFLVLDQQRVVE